MRRRDILGAGAGLIGLGAARAAPGAPSLPEPVDETWLDTARDRELPVRLRWPLAGRCAGAVVHSHGLGGSREGGDVWGRAWQAAGFVVLHVQHPGSDTETLRRGALALHRAASAEQLVARVGDMRFVLDEIERRAVAGGAWRQVPQDRIGASGHSFGAQTVQAIAGKRYGARRAPDFREPRYRAFIAFSPALGRGDTGSPAQQFGAIERPFLVVTGSKDGDPLGSAMSGADRARVFDGLPPGRRGLLWLDGADHMTFGGNAEHRIQARRGPFSREPEVAALEDVHHDLVARLTTLWWQARLLDDPAALTALATPLGLGPADRWQMD